MCVWKSDVYLLVAGSMLSLLVASRCALLHSQKITGAKRKNTHEIGRPFSTSFIGVSRCVCDMYVYSRWEMFDMRFSNTYVTYRDLIQRRKMLKGHF